MGINTNYYNYSSMLFNNTSSTGNANTYNTIGTSNGYSYGKNNVNFLSSEAQTFVANAKKESSNLKDGLSSLTGKGTKEDAVFKKTTAISDDTDVLRIQAVDAKKALKEDVKVEIEQVASTQKNSGTALKSDAKNSNTSGYYRFEVEVEGKKHQISFNTTANDTNQTLQQKMADAINKKNIGINATVSTDAKSKTSVLNLESKTTGTRDDGKAKFTIQDLLGDVVAKTGVGSITQEAKDAVYKINGGKSQISKTNNVDLGNGIKATLQKASTKEISITMGKDTISSLNKTREMVNAYNGLLHAAQENNGDNRSKRIQTELKGISKVYNNSLKEVGIQVSKDGYMSIDEDKMKAAAENGKLEKLFTKDGQYSNYGFANKLSRTAENVSKDTMAYVNPGSVANKQNTNYFDSSSYLNYSQMNKVNQFANMGILFDSLF